MTTLIIAILMHLGIATSSTWNDLTPTQQHQYQQEIIDDDFIF